MGGLPYSRHTAKPRQQQERESVFQLNVDSHRSVITKLHFNIWYMMGIKEDALFPSFGCNDSFKAIADLKSGLELD